MTRILIRVGLIVTLFTAATTLRAAEAATRPNIMIILTDDMGWSDLGCYGGEINTPNLDKLAANGLRFTQFYNTGRCCPTRAALLTGLYSHQTGVGHMVEDRGLPAYRGELNHRCVTIPEVLGPAGYSTYAVGKWHVARTQPAWPRQRGFEHFYGTLAGAGNYFAPKELYRDNTPVDSAADPEYRPVAPDPYYYTDAITDHAIRFVTDHTAGKSGKPFFMYVAYTAAHWPLHAKPQDIAKYKGKYDAGYDAIRQARIEKQKKLGLLDPRWTMSPTVGNWDKIADKAWESRCMEVYAAQVDCMDQGVGRIVAALEKTGQLNNTLVVYLQDNGACAEDLGRAASRKEGKIPGGSDTHISYGREWANVSNTPLRYYKHWEHEGGVSTPLIVQWPAAIAPARNGSFVKDPAHLVDLMATCADLGQAKYPQEFNGKLIQPMEGISLHPALLGRSLDRANPLFFEHEGNKAIRDGRWKLVLAHSANAKWELYDMDADRAEMHDLITAEPKRAEEMAAKWNAWARRVGAQPWPLKVAKTSAQ